MTITARPLPTIRQLPANLVNQIAAGEVIERPASVVKELLENSIDAGAHRIELTISGGGTELIRISDDGCGMTADQLPLAVTSHATSKLPDDDTLFHVGTLGFRGEALASIGSVSQLTIRSRTEGDDCGAEIRVRGGVVEMPAPAGCPVGTVIEVRQLFFNTPVRRKFLKSAQTERGHIIESFTRLALAHPNVHFVMTSEDKELFDLPPTPRWSERIAAFFGDEISESLIKIGSDDAQVKVSGYTCDPSVSRGNNRMQYLFLNGRHIRDRSLQHALTEAYRGLLMVGRHPVCFLRLEMPADMIDVNVHPSKLEVRFTDSGRVYARLLQTLRHHFLTTDMTMRVGSSQQRSSTDDLVGPPQSVLGMPVHVEQQQRQSVIEWARTGDTSSPSTVHTLPSRGAAEFQPFPDNGPFTNYRPSPVVVDAAPSISSTGVSSPASISPAGLAPWEIDEAESTPPPNANHVPHNSQEFASNASAPAMSHLGFQVHNRYLVTQDEAGMVIVDQHALHERVLYERIREKVLGEGGRLESQRLLVPEPVSLMPAERNAAMDAREALATVGLEVEDFGGETLVIQSVPAMLGRTAPGDMLRTLLECLLGAGKTPEARDLLDHLLHTIACKAAIKAGDPLSREEITSLLEQRELYQDTHHCPHGRPTALFFSRDELDRMFGRLGPRGRTAMNSPS
jgi:DNA mismatch repair protein MutL